jgi:hypothetical protein
MEIASSSESKIPKSAYIDRFISIKTYKKSPKHNWTELEDEKNN